MKIEFAFSLDCECIVDPDQAYDLYWANKIDNKRNFECVGDDCDAQITCANLDKLQEDMKVPPYFKLFGKHSENCTYQLNKVRRYSSQVGNDLSKNRGTISDRIVDVLNFERPESHRSKKQKNFQSQPEIQFSLREKRNAIKKDARSKGLRKDINRYSIRPFISNFYKYTQEQVLENTYVQIKSAKISYADFFVKIDLQNINNLSQYKKVYWGEAKLYDNTSHYNILFDKEFVFNDEKIKPSIYIDNKTIEQTFCRQLMEKKFKKFSGSIVYCFIFAKPYPKKSNNGKNYINFYIDNLDFLEIKKEF